jgi:hypothetical protein
MRNRFVSCLLTGVVAAPIGFLATPAHQNQNITVTVAGAGNGTLAGSTTDASFSVNGEEVTCESTAPNPPASTAQLLIDNGVTMGAAPLSVGSVVKVSFTPGDCTGPLGKVTIRPKTNDHGFFVNSVTANTGRTDIFLSMVNLGFSMKDCSFRVQGEASGYYNNKAHSLTMSPKLPLVPPAQKTKLTITTVNGCAGLVDKGDHPVFEGTYELAPATLTITSS